MGRDLFDNNFLALNDYEASEPLTCGLQLSRDPLEATLSFIFFE